MLSESFRIVRACPVLPLLVCPWCGLRFWFWLFALAVVFAFVVSLFVIVVSVAAAAVVVLSAVAAVFGGVGSWVCGGG